MTTIQIPPGTNIDPYLKAHRNDTRFVLAPGYYTIGTGWAFDRDHDHCSLGPGCELVGAGSRETTLSPSFATEPPDGAKQIEFFTAGSRSGQCDYVAIRGLTINAGGMSDDLGIVGLHVWSDRVDIDDVAVWGIEGHRPDREGFGVLVNQSGAGTSDVWASMPGGSRIENVEVVCEQRADMGENYVCGVYVGYRTPFDATVARNIRVHSGGDGIAHAAFGTNGGVLWSNISNTGRWSRAVFCDTGGGEGTIISASHLRAERVLVEFRGSTGVRWKDILVTDSILEATEAPPDARRDYAAGLVLARDGDLPGAAFDNVSITHCTLRGCGTGDHYAGSIDSTGRDNGIFHSRLVGCAWKPAVVAGSGGFREFGNLRGSA